MTEDVQNVARGITDLGMMAVSASFFLVLTAALWVACFRWFKATIDDVIKGSSKINSELLAETRKQNDMLNDISEGLRPENKERIKLISNTFFDLAAFRILGFIKRVKKENHIKDKEKTIAKIRKFVSNLHSDRRSKFDNFKYRGKTLSDYINPEWVDTVTELVEKEVYDSEPNEDRTYTNVKNTYDEIKINFYDRMNKT